MSPLTFMGHHLPLDGYGYPTIQIARELKALDPRVHSLNMARGGEFSRLDTDRWRVAGDAVLLCTPDWLPNISADRIAIYTMTEATRGPAHWPELINRHAQLCLAPCRWCADVFERSGVNVPILVAPWGINPDHYFYVERAPREPYTFLWSGTNDRRKGWDVAYRAFIQAFGDSTEARLVLHFRTDLVGQIRFADCNVEKRVGTIQRSQWLAMLAEADCFVFPSRGEGWGLPPREAAATGLPALVTDWSGLAHDLEHWGIPIRIAGFSTARYGVFRDIGEWAEPDVDHLSGQMRWCFEHRAEAAHIGVRASRFLRTVTPWSDTAQLVLNAFEMLAALAPARRPAAYRWEAAMT